MYQLYFFFALGIVPGPHGFDTFSDCMEQGTEEMIEFKAMHPHTAGFPWCFRYKRKGVL